MAAGDLIIEQHGAAASLDGAGLMGVAGLTVPLVSTLLNKVRQANLDKSIGTRIWKQGVAAVAA